MKKLFNKTFIGFFTVLVTSLIMMGCTSAPLKIASADTTRPYKVLGPAEGHASGVILFDIIPIRENSKLVRAYDQALKSKGGDAILNPTITENWLFLLVLNKYTTNINGTVIRYTDKA